MPGLSGTIAALTMGATSLFCAHGGVGLVPSPEPSGFEDQFAVAVIEIDRKTELDNVTVGAFSLFDANGRATAMKRVVKIEVFDEPSSSGVGSVAYYLNTSDASRSRPWNGTLPAGPIYLRIRVALTADPIGATRYTMAIGPYTLAGPCDIAWPT